MRFGRFREIHEVKEDSSEITDMIIEDAEKVGFGDNPGPTWKDEESTEQVAEVKVKDVSIDNARARGTDIDPVRQAVEQTDQANKRHQESVDKNIKGPDGR